VRHIVGYLRAGCGARCVHTGRVRNRVRVPVHRGDLAEGQTVLIHAGAGGVGMAAIQLANRGRDRDLDCLLQRREARTAGGARARPRINYATDSFVERTSQLTGSRGIVIVIDSIGGQNVVDSVGVLAYRGTLVSVG
jgi:NADPH2:quinone reductase